MFNEVEKAAVLPNQDSGGGEASELSELAGGAGQQKIPETGMGSIPATQHEGRPAGTRNPTNAATKLHST